MKLEYKEFRLGEIRSQIVSIFDKQARESKIDLDVAFLGPHNEDPSIDFLAVRHPHLRTHKSSRIRDMYVLGDQHRILQVIINLVSNSLKFTSAGGRVQVRIRWGDEILPLAPKVIGGSRKSRSRTTSDKTIESGETSPSTVSKGKAFTTVTARSTPDSVDSKQEPSVMVVDEAQKSTPVPEDTAKSYMFTFEVEDTGRGIPEDMQDKIFEPFVQVDSSFSKEFGGTGLGLSICSQLAKLMEGTITVKSNEGLGSTFCLKIPLKHIADRAASTMSDSTRTRSRAPSAGGSTNGGAGGSSHRNSLSSVLAHEPEPAMNHSPETHRSDIQPRLVGLSTPFFPPNPNQTAALAASTANKEGKQVMMQKDKSNKAAAKNSTGNDSETAAGAASEDSSSDLHVLVADDNATNIEVVRRMLKLEKVHDVTVARDGREAYEAVKANMAHDRKFDLIFMDVQMPNLDGIQSTRLIREMGYGAPIVALTAFSEESNRKECMESGMDEFLAKPIRRSALKSVLTKFATIYEEKGEKGETP